jgi:hypothetical protein
MARREYHNCDNCHFHNVRGIPLAALVALKEPLTQRRAGAASGMKTRMDVSRIVSLIPSASSRDASGDNPA